MAWTPLTFTYLSVLTSAKCTQIQDNFTALAQGQSGAPQIANAQDIGRKSSGDSAFLSLIDQVTVGSYLLAYNMTSTPTQPDAAKPSWALRLGDSADSAKFLRSPAGSTTLSNVFGFDSTGKVTEGTIPLSRIGTVVLDGNTVLSGNAIASVSIQAPDNVHRFYDLSIRSNDGSGTPGKWAQGTQVTTAEAVESDLHSWIQRSANGSTDDQLVLVNGTGTSQTAYYKIYQLTEN